MWSAWPRGIFELVVLLIAICWWVMTLLSKYITLGGGHWYLHSRKIRYCKIANQHGNQFTDFCKKTKNFIVHHDSFWHPLDIIFTTIAVVNGAYCAIKQNSFDDSSGKFWWRQREWGRGWWVRATVRALCYAMLTTALCYAKLVLGKGVQ